MKTHETKASQGLDGAVCSPEGSGHREQLENSSRRRKSRGCQCGADAEGLRGSPAAAFGSGGGLASSIQIRILNGRERVLGRKPEHGEWAPVCSRSLGRAPSPPSSASSLKWMSIPENWRKYQGNKGVERKVTLSRIHFLLISMFLHPIKIRNCLPNRSRSNLDVITFFFTLNNL